MRVHLERNVSSVALGWHPFLERGILVITDG